MPARVLVTGATGFIGRHLIDGLMAIPKFEVLGLGRHGAWEFSGGRLIPSCSISKLALSDRDSLISEFAPTHVINLAGSKSTVGEASDAETSAEFLENLFEIAMKCESVLRFVHVGSCEEYGQAIRPYLESSNPEPTTRYGKSKFRSTQFLLAAAQQSDLEVVVVRPSVVYGPGQSMEMFIPYVLNSIAEHSRIKMTGGKQLRDFLHVEDLVAGLIALVQAGPLGRTEILNFSSGTSHQLMDVVDEILNQRGLIRDEWLSSETLDYREDEVFDYRVSNEKASLILGWKPKISLVEGIAGLVNDRTDPLL